MSMRLSRWAWAPEALLQAQREKPLREKPVPAAASAAPAPAAGGSLAAAEAAQPQRKKIVLIKAQDWE